MLYRILLFCLACALPVRAQVGPSDVRFDRLSLGLPHPEVQALAQDRDGLVWIGTADGLARYDGLSVVVLRRRPGEANSLPSNSIQALHVGRDGTVWVGTGRGLARHDVRTDRMERVSPARGACSGGVSWLAEDAGGRVLYGSRAQGVCRLNPKTRRVEQIRLPWRTAEAGAARAVSLEGLPDGSAWVLGAGGVACRIDGAARDCRAIALRDFEPQVLGTDGDGRLLAYGRPSGGGPRELRRWSQSRFVRVAAELPEFGDSERAHLGVVGREAWLATASSGVLAVGLETGDWRWLAPRPGDPTSLPAERVQALLVDAQGTAWVGTARGLAQWRMPVRPFTVYRRYSGRDGEISDDRVNGMSESRDGALWVSTNDGLNRLDPATGQFETFAVPARQVPGPLAWAPPPGPYQNAWWQVAEASDGTLWVGGKRNGLFRLDRRTGLYRREVGASQALGMVNDAGEPRGFGVRHVFEDASGHLWVGTTGEGLAVRHPDDGRWEGVRPAPGDSTLPHPSVNRVFQDASGRLWVGTDAGLAEMTHDDKRRSIRFGAVDLGEDTALGETTPVWSIAESAATPGELWVGTVGAGLVRYDPTTGEATRLTTEAGLPSDLVYGVLSDDDGRVWASTSRGLARLDPATGAVRVYNQAHGLQGDAFDLMAFYRSPTTGDLWFGGPNGLIRIDPAGVGVAAYRPPVAFTSVRVRDVERPGRPLDGDTLRLRHDQNFLSVQFAALDYTAPRALRYRYRLVGVDDGWRETTGERPTATYTELAPGTYRLDVVGSNADAVFNDAPAALTVVIEPAWWQRAPVRALVMVLVALGAVGVVGVLLRRAARSHRHASASVAEALHAGPILRIGEIGHDMDLIAADGSAARVAENGHADVVHRVRERVGDVEHGLHDALLSLDPEGMQRLGLSQSLDATVRRFRRAAPHVTVQADWSQAPDGLDDQARRDVVEVVTNAMGHVLRVAAPSQLDVSLAEERDAAVVRVASDGDMLVSTALRRRLGRTSGLARVLRVVRDRGGTLDVEETSGGSAVVVTLPASAG